MVLDLVFISRFAYSGGIPGIVPGDAFDAIFQFANVTMRRNRDGRPGSDGVMAAPSLSLVSRPWYTIFDEDFPTWPRDFSSRACWLISSSWRSKSTVLWVESRSSSWTLKNLGFSWEITQHSGEMDTSQSVNAYNASIHTDGEMSAGTSMTISTFWAVLSTICLILILPSSLTLTIESLTPAVVTPKAVHDDQRAGSR